MAEKNPGSTQEQQKRMAEALWLRYFNQTLFEKGLITETERNRMATLISRRESTEKL